LVTTPHITFAHTATRNLAVIRQALRTRSGEGQGMTSPFPLQSIDCLSFSLSENSSIISGRTFRIDKSESIFLKGLASKGWKITSGKDERRRIWRSARVFYHSPDAAKIICDPKHQRSWSFL